MQFLYENRARAISKRNFKQILSRVWSKCITTANITSGFRATGLHPLNPNVPETAFAPSILTERLFNAKTILSNDDEAVEPLSNLITGECSGTTTDTNNDSRSSSPIATLQELNNLISSELLPTTLVSPDIQILQNYSSACHTLTCAGTSGTYYTRALVYYSDTSEESLNCENLSKFDEADVVNKFSSRPVRTYSSSSSDSDMTKESPKTRYFTSAFRITPNKSYHHKPRDGAFGVIRLVR